MNLIVIFIIQFISSFLACLLSRFIFRYLEIKSMKISSNILEDFMKGFKL